jgi:hypothetical protein
MAATTITIDGIVTCVDQRSTRVQMPGTDHVNYRVERAPLVTLSLSSGDSIDVPWSGSLKETPFLHSRWRVTIAPVVSSDPALDDE